MKRDPSIELYRVMLMFGICLLHSITLGEHQMVVDEGEGRENEFA